MAVLYSNINGDAEEWRTALEAFVPNLDFRNYPDEIGDPADIEFALVWKHPKGDLQRYPNLRAILSIGAGVEHVLTDPELPAGVPVVRLVDELLAQDMAHHAAHWVLHFHRNYHVYPADQAAKRWQRQPFTETAQRRIAILGLGEIGQCAAQMIRGLGFPVLGWSRSPKDVAGVTCFHGTDGLDRCLAQSDMVIGVLPATAETDNLLNSTRLSLLPAGAFIINIGRGNIIDDDALIAALDQGHVAAAALDVFRTEPLPAESPFWSHPAVFVTPHAAGPTNKRSAARALSENIARVQAGKPPHPVVDRKRGY